jgi:hypothetical protein
LPTASSGIGWPFTNGLFGRQAGPGPSTKPESAGPDEIWDNAVTRQESHLQELDPAFDPGHLPYHVFVNAGILFVKPQLENDTAFIHSQPPTVGSTTQLRSSVTSFTFDGEFTPRVSLGGTLDSGWGLRTTWWHFAEGSSTFQVFNFDPAGTNVFQSTPVPGIPGITTPGPVAKQFGIFNNILFFGSHLETHVWDSEFTRNLDLGDWCVLLSAGVRYTYLSQGYVALRNNSGTGRSSTSRVTLSKDSDLVLSGHNLSAGGPTVALEVRRSLGDTGWALYGIGRSSVVFGRGRMHSQQITVENATITPTSGKAQTINTLVFRDAANGRNDDLPVEEIELGLQWSHSWGRAVPVLQVGVVYEDWISAGNATSEKGDLSFFGLRLTAGITY